MHLQWLRRTTVPQMSRAWEVTVGARAILRCVTPRAAAVARPAHHRRVENRRIAGQRPTTQSGATARPVEVVLQVNH